MMAGDPTSRGSTPPQEQRPKPATPVERDLVRRQERRERAEQADKEARYQRDLSIHKARAAGIPIARIAELIGVSVAWVQQPWPPRDMRDRFAADVEDVYRRAGDDERAARFGARIRSGRRP